VIHFPKGRKYLAGRHLKLDQVDPQYRPLRELLLDHLAQGVWRYCLFPGWTPGDQQHLVSLDLVPEDINDIFPGNDESQEDDLAIDLATGLKSLGLSSRG
jgi:hypothetical protein